MIFFLDLNNKFLIVSYFISGWKTECTEWKERPNGETRQRNWTERPDREFGSQDKPYWDTGLRDGTKRPGQETGPRVQTKRLDQETKTERPDQETGMKHMTKKDQTKKQEQETGTRYRTKRDLIKRPDWETGLRETGSRDTRLRDRTEGLERGTGQRNWTERLNWLLSAEHFLILKEFAEMSQATVKVEREKQKTGDSCMHTPGSLNAVCVRKTAGLLSLDSSFAVAWLYLSFQLTKNFLVFGTVCWDESSNGKGRIKREEPASFFAHKLRSMNLVCACMNLQFFFVSLLTCQNSSFFLLRC